MKVIWDFFDRLERRMRSLGAVCLMGMVVMTCCDVIGRVFDYPIFGTEEIVSFLLTLVIALSLPYSHLEKIHVGVEIVFRLLPPKAQLALKVLTDTASLLLMITIAVMMFSYFADSRSSGEVSMNLEFPEYIIIFSLATCFMILNFFIVRDIVIVQEIKDTILSSKKKKGAV